MKNKIKKSGRHGDIYFLATDKKVGKKSNTKTVAYGEVTGHHHSFGDSDSVVCFVEDDEVKRVEVLENSTITHQEHKPIEVEAGTYLVYRKFEYDPFGEYLRKVRD